MIFHKSSFTKKFTGHFFCSYLKLNPFSKSDLCKLQIARSKFGRKILRFLYTIQI